MNHEAIYSLYPQVVFIDDTGAYDSQRNKIVIDESAVNSWVNPNQYKMDRVLNYPSLGDQLDMLWHAIDAGTLNKTSAFYKTLKAVKDEYPKAE